MAGSKPDVINAALGAAFGGIAGLTIDYLIEGLKFVCECPEQCKALREQLERIQPSLKNISAHHKTDPTKEKWLTAFRECIDGVDGVKDVLKKCGSESPSIWDGISKVRYGNKILKLRDRIKDLVNEAPFLLLAPQNACGIVQEVPRKIFGMKDHLTRVKSSVLEGRESESNNCVGIRGMGGAGKTLLAQMVNNDQEIQQVFGKDSIIWITVGRDAKVSDIYDRMRKRLCVRSDGGSLQDQRTDLCNAFSERSVLLILDDVWDGKVHECEDMLDWLNIATGPGSVTLVTTRDESVTRKCVTAGVEIILRLPEEQSWELFCIHAFGTDTPIFPKDLEGLARDVCKECDCLPLALKVIGRAMKGKCEVGEWRKTLRRLRASSIMGDKSVDRQLFERLRFSYDELDDPKKTCFLYFAAFPEDCEVPVDHLCRIWIAEGLFGDHDLDVKAASDEAESAVKELLDRSLIEECTVEDWEGRKRAVKMHDILRDLAIQMTREGEECERESLFMMERKDLEEFPRTWLGRELKVKRLSLWGNKIKRFPENFKAPNLKICILYPISWDFSPEWRAHGGCEIEESFFYELHALKFLQVCSNLSIKKLPESIGGLGSLQHLRLDGCEALEQLPESIGGLGSLQHLNLAYCEALEQLPESIGELGSLQHLSLQGCEALKQLPESIGGLGSLQHLNLAFCEALEQLLKSIGGLGSLQHLSLEGCIALEQLPESIGGLGCLQHLSLEGCIALEQLPESIGGLGCLQHLNLQGCWALKKLPESIAGLGCLQHLNLAFCRALKHLPESIGELGSLQHLSLEGCTILEQLPESIEGLGSIQDLNLAFCRALKKLPESIGGLGSLQHLSLQGCWALKELPESIGGLGSLQHLNLKECTALEQLPHFVKMDQLKILS
ncbi:hypothetical protein KC19_12G111300 [Ceratodon purpureus]|uniref:NB-ARC domain-containing protein n=1 Tax=Ceratodon purpureus TaxID=3225 RepID=A0A8T0G8N0_CERPU|nr:hypothetical protein KC19_12G111300 [Ceratodon purpureus]